MVGLGPSEGAFWYSLNRSDGQMLSYPWKTVL